MSTHKKLVLKALTDANFRKLLKENPEEALNLAEVKGGQVVASQILFSVNAIDSLIADISDYLLCKDPGQPCGIC
jgi:hypothetical protein